MIAAPPNGLFSPKNYVSPIYVWITLNIKFYEILLVSSRANLATKFLSHTHTHTDRHFPEIVNSCSGHAKTCKFIKNWKSKIFMKLILCSIYIEVSKKECIMHTLQSIYSNYKDRVTFKYVVGP